MLLVLKQSEKMFPGQHQLIWFRKRDKKYPTPTYHILKGMAYHNPIPRTLA